MLSPNPSRHELNLLMYQLILSVRGPIKKALLYSVNFLNTKLKIPRLNKIALVQQIANLG